MSFKMAKIIVVVTIIEFCKGGAHIWRGEGRLILLDYVHMGIALSCERLVSRFSISIFQEHVPIQCHYERMFISHRRSENSPVTRQKSSAKCLVAYHYCFI